MKIPANANQDVQTSFREVWQELNRLKSGQTNLSGNRISNVGAPVDSFDVVRKVDIEQNYSFDAFYNKLKQKGLDGFPGILASIQPARVSVVKSTTRPPVTAVGKLFYESDTNRLRMATGTAYITIVTVAGLLISDVSAPTQVTDITLIRNRVIAFTDMASDTAVTDLAVTIV